MKSVAFTFVLMLTLTAQVLAASPEPADFAYGCQLPAADDGGVFSLVLPLAVYEQVTQPTLGDLRVFNGAGEAVPHTVRRPAAEHNIQETQKPLPLFPLASAETADAADLALRVRRSADGTVITVDAGQQPPGKTPVAYLVDTSKATAVPAALELAWNSAANPVLTLSLSQSSDLTHWQPLVSRIVLADLQYDGKAIAQRRIQLHGKTKPYLRIDCLDCREPLQLQSVTAVFQAQAPVTANQWLDLRPAKTERRQGELIYEYELAPKLTVSSLQLALPVANTLVQASIESRRTAEDPWRLQHAGHFYALDLEGHQLGNPPIVCPPNGDRYWRIRIPDNGSGLDENSRAPALQLGWRPDQLLFVGRGKGPYTLAFGSTSQQLLPGNNGELIVGALRETQAESLIRRIEPGPVFALGGEQALKPQLSTTSWKKMILWGVLIAGVALLALMTRAIFREMGKKAGD